MSDTSPDIRHRVRMPDGKHVEVVYRDHLRAPGQSGEPDVARAPDSVRDASHVPEPMPGAPTSDHAMPGHATSGHAIPGAPMPDTAAAIHSRAAGLYRVPQPTFSAEPACAPEELHVCFNCTGELVYPLDWSEEGDRHWRIVLRCPECEALREGVFEQSLVELLDDELDRGAGALLSDLKRITHSNMAEEIDFFVRALDADLVTPSDF